MKCLEEKCIHHDVCALYTCSGYASDKCGFYETRPHGECIDESKDALKCSACGKWVYKPFIGGFPTERTQHYNPNYCAFCGADMREGEAE